MSDADANGPRLRALDGLPLHSRVAILAPSVVRFLWRIDKTKRSRQALVMFGNFRVRRVLGVALSGLCLLIDAACSSSGGGTASMGSGGMTTTRGGSSGANSAAGATSGGAGNIGGSAAVSSGAGGAIAGGTNVGGSALGGNAGAGGSPSGGSAGSGGAVATCTPGTGTTDIDGDTVLDNHTCLTWQKTIHATGQNWLAENQYCDDLTQGGFSDWRMPTLEELASWPIHGPDGGNIMTSPRYVGPTWTDEQKNGDFHLCMRTFYQAGCGWQGSQNVYGTVCVRGQGTNLTAFDKVCDNTCTTHLTAYGCTGADCFVPWQ